jgi:beta-lactamase superfamily II metal-dependent hydrolase
MFLALLVLSMAPAPGGAGLHWIHVGQGSALLAVSGQGSAVLVDAGPAGAAEPILAALASHGVEHVDLWVHTHFDADHIGGTPRVLLGMDDQPGTGDEISVGVVWDRGLDALPDTDTVQRYLDAVWEVRRVPGAGERWSVPGLQARALSGSGAAEAARENDRGLALCLDVGGVRVFIPGDLPSDLAAERATDCSDPTVWWLGHHGSRDGTDAQLVERVGARTVVISAGLENGHCHPHGDVLTLLGDRQVWITGAAGIAPGRACQALASFLGPGHRVAGADLWMGVSR